MTGHADTLGEVVGLWLQPEDNLPRVVGEVLASARRRVDVASFLFPTGEVLSGLSAAHERGVAVRLIVDGSVEVNWRMSGSVRFDCRYVDVGRGSMHHKFAVVDDVVLVGGPTTSTRTRAAAATRCCW